MLTFELTREAFTSIKDTLRLMLPGAGSARRVEAAARGLGFNTHAALRASLSKGPASVTADPEAFSAFLTEANERSGDAFLSACAVQVMLATVARFPDLRMDDLARHLGTDARTWAHWQGRGSASKFLAILESLGTSSFLRGFNRIDAYRIMLLMEYDPFYPPGTAVATAAALHAGFRPMDRLWRGPVTFHVPSLQGPEADPAYRHKEFGFAFECLCPLLGRHTRYGYGTVAEASRYADLLRAARDGTCSSHRTLSRAEWDVVRVDPRIHVFDLCSEVADLEGRPYPGRPWSEERARVRDVHPLSQRVGQVVGARIPG